MEFEEQRCDKVYPTTLDMKKKLQVNTFHVTVTFFFSTSAGALNVCQIL